MEKITVETTVNAPIEKVWNLFTLPEHITKWAFASDDWHAPSAENDLRNGGKFTTRMEAKDGSFGFDFGGTYDAVKDHELIEYTLGDGRKVEIHFITQDDQTKIEQRFDPEDQNSADMQKAGWQLILDNFRKYTEANA